MQFGIYSNENKGITATCMTIDKTDEGNINH